MSTLLEIAIALALVGFVIIPCALLYALGLAIVIDYLFGRFK